jgi:hypothetical protein
VNICLSAHPTRRGQPWYFDMREERWKVTPRTCNANRLSSANPSLRYLELNRWINAEYGRLGARFQAIIHPSFGSTGVSDAYAGWFAFAAFASRGIARRNWGLQIALDAARL